MSKEKKNMKKTNKEKKKLSFKVVLLMLCIIPLVICAVVTSMVLVNQSRGLIEQSVTNGLYALSIAKGESLQTSIESSEEILKGFAASAEVRELLENPGNAELTAKAQQYTVDYFSRLEGWEGLYIADWGSTVLTHPAPPVVGKTMREGDRLKELQNAMIAGGDIYNAGIIVSPASGLYTVSMYAPVYDETGNPIGYVGGGSFAAALVEKCADVSSMGIQSAYAYVVAPDGNFVYHPSEDKIGTPVTNEVVSALMERIKAGEHPEANCVTYFYNGAYKYAGYYVAPDNGFVFVITGDKDEVLAGSRQMAIIAVVVTLILILVSATIAVVIAIKIASPINDVAKKCNKFANGDLSVAFANKSNIQEIQLLLDNLNLLKTKISEVVHDIQASTEELVNNSMDLKNAVETSVESVSQISEAINDVAQGNTDLASNVSTQMASVQELGANIDESNDEIIHMSDVTASTVELSKQASILMSELIDLTNITKTNIDSISAQSEKNVRAAEEINQITEAISDITSQTNLLSLNASIEAARAGEAGRGFSVVASEIRNLADNSANQTNNIKEIIQKLLETINETNEISDNLVTSAFTQLEKLDITRDMFNKVISQISAIGDNTNTVSSNMGNITEIKNSVTDIAENLSAVSQQTSASSEEVAASAQLVNESINGLSSVVVNLENMASRLQESASYFK